MGGPSWVKRVIAVAGAAVAALLVAAPAGAYDAKVRVTSFGIPHVKAKGWGSAGYGVGYAFAKDNLCTFADDIVTLRARRSKYFGPDGQTNGSASAPVNNLDSDLFWQSVIDSRRVEKLLRSPRPEGPSTIAKRMVRGYAAGYNAYLRRVGRKGIKDERCRNARWVKRIKPIDIWRRLYQADLLASSQVFISDIVGAAPPGEPLHRSPVGPKQAAKALPGSPYDLNAARDPDLPGPGSNALAVGPEDSRNGDPLLLGNPHFPWQGTERFWHFHVKIPGRLNVMGASLMGFPLVNIGHNEHVAWSHTVSTASRFTLFELELDPADPTRYMYDGRSRAMKERRVSVPVKGGGRERTTIYTTRFGPVLARPGVGIGWSDTTAFALGDANDHIRAANSFLAMNRAKSARALIRGQSRFQGVPWVNTIGVDDSGHAFYADNSVVPNVPQEKIDTCIKPGISQLIYQVAGIISLDGSKPSCNWDNDPDAAVKGIFGPGNLPIQFRKDYALNANDSFWLANAKAPLTGFSPIIGCQDCEQGLRTRLGHKMVAERMDATDGLSPRPGFTLQNLQRMWLGDRSEAAELAAGDLAEVCADNPEIAIGGGKVVDVSEACPILAAYNQTGKLDSPGGWLFNVWYWKAWGGSEFFDVPFDPAHPLTTPNTLNQANPDTIEALGEAVDELRGLDIPLAASYGDVQHTTSRRGTIPIHGCGTGCWQAIYSNTGAGSPDYGQVTDGSSTVQFTRMSERGPRGKWILTYSQSERADSPHRSDQTRVFSRSELIPMRFRGPQIQADPKLRTYRLRGR